MTQSYNPNVTCGNKNGDVCVVFISALCHLKVTRDASVIYSQIRVCAGLVSVGLYVLLIK